MKKYLIVLSILVLTLNCVAQQYLYHPAKVSALTKKIVKKIETENMLLGSAVGYGGVRPKQFDNFNELEKTAHKEELLELINHPNGVVRCYSFWAITHDSTINLLPIILDHINDTTNVATQFGCIISDQKAGDFFIDLVTPELVDLDSKKLDSVQLTIVDSVLIYTPNKLYAKNKAILGANTTEGLYERLRDLAVKDKNQSALVPLAKYRKEQDIPIILKNNDANDGQLYTYKAICEFPHQTFFPFLKESVYATFGDDHFSNEWQALYDAIAGFKNQQALQVLKAPFTQIKHESIKRYHIDFIFNSLQKYYTPIYDTLLWEIWEKEKKINPEAYQLLYSKNPNRALTLTLESVQNMYFSSTLLEMMLDTLIAHNTPVSIKLINQNLLEADVFQFPSFADKASKLKDISFINSFFIRLETESNPHVYLKIAAILLGLGDNNINSRIIEVSKRNTNLREGWGGEKLSQLLVDYNLH